MGTSAPREGCQRAQGRGGEERTREPWRCTTCYLLFFLRAPRWAMGEPRRLHPPKRHLKVRVITTASANWEQFGALKRWGASARQVCQISPPGSTAGGGRIAAGPRSVQQPRAIRDGGTAEISSPVGAAWLWGAPAGGGGTGEGPAVFLVRVSLKVEADAALPAARGCSASSQEAGRAGRNSSTIPGQQSDFPLPCTANAIKASCKPRVARAELDAAWPESRTPEESTGGRLDQRADLDSSAWVWLCSRPPAAG